MVSRHVKLKYQKTIDDLIQSERNILSEGDSAQRDYDAFHDFRHRESVRIATQLVPSQDATVLDVGRSRLTRMLAGHYKNLTSFGFPIDETAAALENPRIPHVTFDLTRSEFTEEWPDLKEHFDLIIFCETIEHLNMAPEFAMLLLSYLLKDTGRLLVTTPNGARLSHRIHLALGRNPFEKIRFFSRNPGHFREYTRKELAAMAEPCGLRCLEVRTHDMYPRVWKRFIPAFPPFGDLKDNLIAIYTKHPLRTV